MRATPRFLARETEMSGVPNQGSTVKQQWPGGEDEDFCLGQNSREGGGFSGETGQGRNQKLRQKLGWGWGIGRWKLPLKAVRMRGSE